jgi:hypothetical protein
MKAIIAMMFFLIACKNDVKDTCTQVVPNVRKGPISENFSEFRIYFLSFPNSGLLKEVLAQLNHKPLNGSIIDWESPDHKAKYYTLVKDSGTINNEVKISMKSKCYSLKLDPEIRNYLFHFESVDSISCFGNNEEFIAIE